MSAYGSRYSMNNVLIRLIENRRHALYNNLFIGAVLVDLSKAFVCIPFNLLIAKLHVKYLDFDSVAFLHNYLRAHSQSESTGSPFKMLKNAFYFTPKALFVLKIFKFLS